MSNIVGRVDRGPVDAGSAVTQRAPVRVRRAPVCIVIATLLLLATTGCPPRGAVEPVAEVVPRQVAVERVNANVERVQAPLNARGRVRGYVTDAEGRRRHFNLAAHLFYLQPQYLSLDLKDDLAGSQFLIGSNDAFYWMHSKPQGDAYWCRRHDAMIAGRDRDLPINPIELIEALGLNPVSLDVENPYDAPVQRIVDEYQQLIFVEIAPERESVIRKEYWLSRRPPFLVTHIVFRDAWGRIEFASLLSEYKAMEDGGPLLATRIEVMWPGRGARMEFDISNWRAVPMVRPDGPQFTPPHRRGVTFEQAFIDEP